MIRTVWMIRFTVILCMLTVAPSAAAAPEPCLKLVFGRYCLGGDMRPLLQAVPPPLVRQDQGTSLALVFSEGPDRDYVLAVSNQIYKVVRAFGVSTQLTYEETYSALREIYGAGEDQSRFPADAVTTTRRLISIRRGEGRALHVWKPSPSWHIELSWTREMGVALAYIATALNAARAGKLEGGL